MRRKVIALTALATLEPQGETHTLYAACDDGTMWSLHEGAEIAWIELPRIPGTERSTFMPGAFATNSRDRVLQQFAERIDNEKESTK